MRAIMSMKHARTFSLVCLMLFLFACSSTAFGETRINTMPPLTEQEARVIHQKGTEAPNSGELLHNKAPGTYICRQCGIALYKSADKFESGCGWPSFDDAIRGAVLRKPDADGVRTEILCANCGGHLGHVFEGEGFTAKNTRHCVNSISMRFIPEGEPLPMFVTPAQAIFAGGCFWGIEDAFSKLPGVFNVISGYTGGYEIEPLTEEQLATMDPSQILSGQGPSPVTYEIVSYGKKGFVESVLVTYNKDIISYETLAKEFFEIHDPTQLNRQGPDIGVQYRSAIFYANEEQKAVAEKLVGILITKGYDVVTQIVPVSLFFPAEDYHQDYTARTGKGACHRRVKRFD